MTSWGRIPIGGVAGPGWHAPEVDDAVDLADPPAHHLSYGGPFAPASKPAAGAPLEAHAVAPVPDAATSPRTVPQAKPHAKPPAHGEKVRPAKAARPPQARVHAAATSPHRPHPPVVPGPAPVHLAPTGVPFHDIGPLPHVPPVPRVPPKPDPYAGVTPPFGAPMDFASDREAFPETHPLPPLPPEPDVYANVDPPFGTLLEFGSRYRIIEMLPTTIYGDPDPPQMPEPMKPPKR